MRTLFLPFSLLAAISGAQSLPYRRVEALGPTVPDGSSYALDVADSGWSIVNCQAPNVTDPARFPSQYFFRSPEGTLTRIPFEKTGIDLRGAMVGVISPDGSYAVFGGPYTSVFRVDRETLAIRTYTGQTQGRFPVRVVGSRAYIAYFYQSLAALDLDTGAVKELPLPSPDFFSNLLRVSSDGGTAIYQMSTGYLVQNLTTGEATTWNDPNFKAGVVDTGGRYVWGKRLAGEWGKDALVRHDLSTGNEDFYGYPAGAQAQLVATTARYAFFSTREALVSSDKNDTADIYVFDRTTGKLTLLSTRQTAKGAAGGVQNLRVSPDGARTLFTSPVAGVTDLVYNGFDQLYARPLGGTTAAALVAKGPGGGEAGDGVISRGGVSVLWSRYSGTEWSARIVKEGQPTRVVPTGTQPYSVDVSDRGKLALWTNLERTGLTFYRDGAVVPLDLQGLAFERGRIEPKTGTPCALLRRLVDNQSSYELWRFDPATGAGQRIDTASPVDDFDFDADAGRVAWPSAGGVAVVDLASDESHLFAHTVGTYHLPPKLTADGNWVAVADIDENRTPLSTRLIRLRDGVVVKKLPFGNLFPDGQWLLDSWTGELVYLKTKARQPLSIDGSLYAPGEPVGPAQVAFRFQYRDGENELTLGDVWRFRAVAPSFPITRFFIALVRAGGNVEIRGEFRQAGLENAATWTEFRVDGGAWTRMKGEMTIVKLADGPHLIEERAADALGRVEPNVSQRTVVADSVPPTVGKIAVKKVENGFEMTVVTDAPSGSVTIVSPDGTKFQDGGRRDGDVLKAVFLPNVTGRYTYQFVVRDRAGNTAKSKKGAFNFVD